MMSIFITWGYFRELLFCFELGYHTITQISITFIIFLLQIPICCNHKCALSQLLIKEDSHKKAEPWNSEDFALNSSPFHGTLKVLLVPNFYYIFFTDS